jgi:chromatin assembly factor 1 subunit B
VSCRRLSFSPDGALLVVPTGVHRDLKAPANAQQARTYATHVFVRDSWQTPAVSLAGLEEPSVGVRFCPRPFQLLAAEEPPLFQAPYRWLFAVVTIGSVFVYDTQHPHPLFKVTGIHYAAINDVAWSADGRLLTVCSSDGYLTFVRFAEGALGQALPDDLVPPPVRRSHAALFPDATAKGAADAVDTAEAAESAEAAETVAPPTSEA